MGISRKQLHVPVLPLHVPEGPFLGGRHPDGLRGLSRGRGLRGRLGRFRRLRGLGRRCWDGLFGRHRLRALGRFLEPGGRPLRLGAGAAGVGGSAGAESPRAQPKASRARWQEPAQAPAQPRDQPEALQPQEPRGAPHSQPFMLLQKIQFSISRNTQKETLVPRVFTTLPSTSVSLK